MNFLLFLCHRLYHLFLEINNMFFLLFFFIKIHLPSSWCPSSSCKCLIGCRRPLLIPNSFRIRLLAALEQARRTGLPLFCTPRSANSGSAVISDLGSRSWTSGWGLCNFVFRIPPMIPNSFLLRLLPDLKIFFFFILKNVVNPVTCSPPFLKVYIRTQFMHHV